ncbi:MAG: bifunctional phosphoribosylaminoimidazolecarboxamide formyltransferase/IMP cyclohydrolase, partial [Limisphaerales bacterium]
PNDYAEVSEEIKSTGETSLELRRRFAAKVFARTAAYDSAIAAHLAKTFSQNKERVLPNYFSLHLPQAQSLRYGENPHQCAALYGNFKNYFQQLHGKELSYNNILDLTAAANLISEFSREKPTVAILKHTNPCGVAQGENLRAAWNKAFATDKQAPFGGVIALNQTLGLDGAEAIAEIFCELVVAPNFSAEALALLKKKKNLRLLKILKNPASAGSWDIRSIGAESFLIQESDGKIITPSDFKIVTKRKPTEREIEDMLFGWRVVKHVKSNAIVFVENQQTLGIGAGQMSRVDASRIAVWKERKAKLSLEKSVACSDAFFPFADGLMAAAEAGATAAIQPGGSLRDAEVIAAADERNMAMAFTGVRHFRH